MCVCVRLQVSGKLIDKEQILEEEIQLRERIQLQCKQAERMVEDLKMELHTTNQARDDLAKQVKTAQVSFEIAGGILQFSFKLSKPCGLRHLNAAFLATFVHLDLSNSKKCGLINQNFLGTAGKCRYLSYE